MLKGFNLKATSLVLSTLALLFSSAIFANENCGDQSHERHGCRVIPAQANFQDQDIFFPESDRPIPFTEKNFRTNVDVNHDKTVFEVEVPGLYSLDAFLLVGLPNIGDSVAGFITINGKKLLPFFSQETRTAGPIVNFHFNDRLVYLKKGDRVSVVLSPVVEGTTIFSRGFVMVALNNSF